MDVDWDSFWSSDTPVYCRCFVMNRFYRFCHPEANKPEIDLMNALTSPDLTAAEKLAACDKYSEACKKLEVDEVGCG